MPTTTLIQDLDQDALGAWTAVALGYPEVFHNGDQLLSPDPEDAVAYDTHDYLRDGPPHARLWTWWIQRATPGHALRMVDGALGVRHEAVIDAMAWSGDSVAEALCRALVAATYGVSVPSRYPWGNTLTDSDSDSDVQA